MKPKTNSKTKKNNSKQRSKSPANGFAPVPKPEPKKEAKLGDLCAEDKSKIGDLVKKLASETKLR